MRIEITAIGFILIIVGIAIMIIGALWGAMKQNESEINGHSKGIILIGPIPIVWGFGNKTKILWLILLVVFSLILIIGLI